jgi:hypothetical protein
MYLINDVSSDPYQRHTYNLSNGDQFSFTICFVPMQYGWFIRDLTYQNVTINNLRICTSPNFLHQWRNLLPFGMACITKDNREPMFEYDFSSTASNLYILTSEEVAAYQQFLTNG